MIAAATIMHKETSRRRTYGRSVSTNTEPDAISHEAGDLLVVLGVDISKDGIGAL